MRDRTSSSFALATCSSRDDSSCVTASISSRAACSSLFSFASSAFAAFSSPFVALDPASISAMRAVSSASRWLSLLFEQLCLLGDLFLERGLALGQSMLELGLTLRELRLQLGLALVGGATQLGHGGRRLLRERFLALGEQPTGLRLALLDLRLELFACRADPRFQLGLALDQIGGVRCLQAVDLRACGAELLAEDARLLLLGPQRAELVADVDQFGGRVRELGLRGLGRLAGVECLDVRRVQVLLQLLGALRVGPSTRRARDG